MGAKPKPLPSREYLNQCFRYEDGKLYWKSRPESHFSSASRCDHWNSRNQGKEAGYEDKAWLRWKITICDSDFFRHRIVWAMHNDIVPDLIDHKNRNKRDDRIDNLRESTVSQNAANAKLSSANTSGYRGVTWDKSSGKWRSQIEVNGKAIYLGWFDDVREAAAARISGEGIHFGAFASCEQGV